MTILKLGSRGPAVTELQTQLKALGYNLGKAGIDGKFGGDTKTAVMAFQKAADISVDGEVGNQTRTALDAALKPSTLLPAAGKYSLSAASRKNLIGVHPDLVRVVERAIQITPVDFRVGEGVRTLARQKQMIAQKKSQTMRSRHVPESNACRMSCAVDLYALPDGALSWDWKYYEQLNQAMQQAARDVGVPIEWGGSWKMRDGVHFQLPWSTYK